jgi:beta-glucosidase/6-phospho-beta-glucosidase/beta-galactosidase
MAALPPLLATLDGYAVEGGFDVPGGIATCYSPAIGLGRLAGPGEAANLWRDYELAIAQVPALGLDGIRLTVEWTRVEPRADVVDVSAWERYRDVIRFAKSLDLYVSVAVVDSVWPAWLGAEAWLMPWVRTAFSQHLDNFANALGSEVDSVVPFTHGPDLVESGFLRGTIPPWRKRERADAADARLSMASMIESVASHGVLGPLVCIDGREIPAQLPESAWPAVVSEAQHASEVYVKSLVRGMGPTSSTSGLVTISNGVATLEVPQQLLELWRS